MNFLPIAERELRLLARKPFTYYSRSFAGLLAALISIGIVYASFSGVLSVTSAGQQLFLVLSVLSYLYVSFEGALITCDCLSREKREGTLGLLFLTDLKGYDIVLGKLVARVSRSFYCLMAILPAPAFAFFLGGVSVGDFIGMALALLNTLFFSAAVGLFVSSLVRRANFAIGITMMLVYLFTFIFPGLGCGFPNHTLTHILLFLSPGGAFLSKLTVRPIALPPSVFAQSFWISHLLAWGFLALAGYRLPKSFVDKPAIPHTPSKLDAPIWPKPKAKIPVAGLPPESPTLLRSANKNAGGLRAIMPLAAVAALPYLFLTIFSPTEKFNPPLFIGTALALHFILKFQTATIACRALTQQRQNGELELLLTTPFDEDQILNSHLLVIKRQMYAPLLFVLGVDAALILAGWIKLGFSPGMTWSVGAAVEIIWLLANLYSLAWVGLYLGLKSNTQAQAVRRTILYVLLMPWLGLLVSLGLFGLFTMGKGFNSNFTPLCIFWFFVLLAQCNLGFTGWAISQLRDKFRLLVTQC